MCVCVNVFVITSLEPWDDFLGSLSVPLKVNAGNVFYIFACIPNGQYACIIHTNIDAYYCVHVGALSLPLNVNAGNVFYK